MAARSRHQFARLAGTAMQAGGAFLPEHKLLKFFLTGIALIFIDRHNILSPEKILMGRTWTLQERSAFRHSVVMQVGEDGCSIFEQKMIHKRADKVSGADVDFLNQRSGCVGDMQNDVA